MTITKDPKTCKMFQSCLCGQRNKCKEMHVNEKQAIRKKFEKKRRLIRTTEDGVSNVGSLYLLRSSELHTFSSFTFAEKGQRGARTVRIARI